LFAEAFNLFGESGIESQKFSYNFRIFEGVNHHILWLFSIVLSILRLDLGVGCVFSGLLISDSLAVTLDGRWSTVSIRASLLLEVGWEPAMLSMSFSPNDRGSFSLIRSWSTAPIDAWPSLLDLRICRVFFKRLFV
ncbi:hypothetical protein KCU96_g26, partial [Aureobasidium melanogenum]